MARYQQSENENSIKSPLTHYALTQLATRQCEHGRNVCCMCPGKAISEPVKLYLERARKRYPSGIEYGPEWKPYAEQRGKWNQDLYRWVEKPGSGLRFVGKVHEIKGNGKPWYRDDSEEYHRLIEHTGWFTDEYQDETICGEVYQLPSRDGREMYVPGVSDPNNDAAVLDFHSVTDDLRQAIRNADSMAEQWAEDEREYQRKGRAKERIEEITSDISELRDDRRALIREIREHCKSLRPLSAVKLALRSELSNMKRKSRKLYREMEKLRTEAL